MSSKHTFTGKSKATLCEKIAFQKQFFPKGFFPKAIWIAVALLMIQLSYAVPNSMNIQGKLTSNGGGILSGTYNFTFRIYDNSTAGSMLYETNLSLTTDSRGVYDAILTNINLPFNKQYYLAVKVMSDSEMQPRINLTSVPYSFKANESEGLNTSKDATVNGNVNISASGNINALGTITGNVLNSISQLNVAGGFSNGGLTIQSNGDIVTYGDVLFSGNISVVNVTYLSVNGTITPGLDNTFDVGNGSLRWRRGNFSSMVEMGALNANSTLFVNGSMVGIGTSSPGAKLHIQRDVSNAGGQLLIENAIASVTGSALLTLKNDAGVTADLALKTSTGSTYGSYTANTFLLYTTNTAGIALMVDGAGPIKFSAGGSTESMRVDSTGNVGIGTTSPQNKLEVIGAATFAGGVNASSLNVTGFSITDDSLVTVVEFKEENKEVKSFKLVEPSQNGIRTDFTEGIKHNKYLNLSIHTRDDATDAQAGRAAVSKTAASDGIWVQTQSNLNENPGGGVSQSSNKDFSIKKVKIKDVKAGDYALSLDEKTGNLVPRKVNALLDHGIKPIYEMTTEDGRAINTTGEHPYLVKLYNKKECDKYAYNVWNKEPDSFNVYCTRWVEVRFLKEGVELAAPRIENDLNSYEIQNLADKCKGRVAQRIEHLCHSEEDASSKIGRKDIKEERKNQAHSLNKAPLSLRGISHEFFLDSEKHRNTHTVKDNKDSDYLNFSENKDITWIKISSIKTLEPQHVYDLSIEGTRNFIANDIVAHNTYLATSSGNVGIGTTSPLSTLHVNGTGFLVTNGSGSNYTAFFVNATSGKAGIGTSSPLRRLDIVDTTSVAPTQIRVRGSASDVGGMIRSGIDSEIQIGGGLEFNGSNWVAKTATASLIELNSGSLAYYSSTGLTAGDSFSLTDRFHIYTNGNVGINESSADAKLEIVSSGGEPPFMISSTASGDGNMMIVLNSGNVGIGTTSPTSTLHVIGTGNFSGNLYAGSCTNQTSPLNQTCTDIAELYAAEPYIEAGDVVCLNSNNKADHCNKNDSQLVLGVISTNPAIIIEGKNIVLGRGDYSNSSSLPIALKGKVPVKADCTHYKIHKGDFLVPSSRKGYAQSYKALKLNSFDDILSIINGNVGKALEECDAQKTAIMAWID